MMLPIRRTYISPPTLAPGDAGAANNSALMGATIKVAIDRTWPIEEILVVVTMKVGTTQFATLTLDNILGIVQRFNLAVNDGVSPRTAVDISGIGLLEYGKLAGLNLDRSTLNAVLASHGSTIAASNLYRVAYRIPLVHPLITEPLRTRMLMDANNFAQDPVLTMQFATAAQIGATGNMRNVSAEIILIRRQIPDALNAGIKAAGGFVPFDLIETPFTIAPGISGEQRFALPVPGSYMNICLRSYLGGSSVTRDVLDYSAGGVADCFAAESRWRIETGSVVLQEWRAKHLQIINDWSCPSNSALDATSPNFGGLLVTNTNWEPAGSYMLDFLTDGLDTANELGSVLDCNNVATNGLKMEIVGSVASVATNASTLNMIGHRLFGDLSKWKTISVA
ncbi:MAG TPA: hypothetical protein VMQ76_10680 [Terracidiphilus sp.]|jgi:hypothetical protein|nr:hypothetical protein [Terracidiphilus sp.]